jgi:HSP20 family molecular chaperone IbpA
MVLGRIHMGSSHAGKVSDIRLRNRLSEAFNQFQERIRERAYQLSLLRDPSQGSPMTDWLEAQAELSAAAHLEVKEQKKNTVVEVTLRDFAPQEIEIEVAGNVLQIFGSHSETTADKKGDGGGSASKTQMFFQSVPLNGPVDVGQSHAKLLKNGKLKVVLPKKSGSATKVG